MHSCFTGVESSPKITDRDIRKQKVVTTAEQRFLQDIAPQPIASWTPGKRLLAVDNRIALIFANGVQGASVPPDTLAGSTLTVAQVGYVDGVTGNAELQIVFADGHGHRLVYRPGLTREAVMADSAITVPFTVDPDMVDAVASRMRGNTYYLMHPRRIAADGTETDGLRYVPVTIADVVPGNDMYPLRVLFVEPGKSDTLAVMMTVGNGRAATRNFDKLFSFENPRRQYPSITDETWDKIRHSRVTLGMTPDECRLALGAPTEYLRYPGQASVIERWTYGDGVYLIFEDGVLTRFRR